MYVFVVWVCKFVCVYVYTSLVVCVCASLCVCLLCCVLYVLSRVCCVCARVCVFTCEYVLSFSFASSSHLVFQFALK